MIGILFLQAWLEDTRRPTLKYVTAYVRIFRKIAYAF